MTDPTIPIPKNLDWSAHPIDRFVLARLEAAEYHTQRRSRPPHARPPAVFRPDRPAADAGRDRRFLHDDSPARLRAARRPAARLAALRRALGPPLARRRPLSPNRSRSAALSCPTPGAIATTSSTPSTTTGRSTSSSASRSPATCCRPSRSEQSSGSSSPRRFSRSATPTSKSRTSGSSTWTWSTSSSTRSARRSSGRPSAAPAATTTSSTRSRRATTTRWPASCATRRRLEHANVSKWMEVPLPLPADEEDEIARHEAPSRLKAKADRRVESDDRKAGARRRAVRGPPLLRPKTCPASSSTISRPRRSATGRSRSIPSATSATATCTTTTPAKARRRSPSCRTLPRNGKYEVRLAYSHAPSRAENVPVTVFSADGERTIQVDQRKPPPIDGRFVSLGEYRFEKAGQSFVIVANEGADGPRHRRRRAVHPGRRRTTRQRPRSQALPTSRRNRARRQGSGTQRSAERTRRRSKSRRPSARR